MEADGCQEESFVSLLTAVNDVDADRLRRLAARSEKNHLIKPVASCTDRDAFNAYICACTCDTASMTKVISLSDKAYGTLKKQKRKDESFSDVVLRLSAEERRESILRFSGAWKGDDADEVFAAVMKDRELSESRRVEI